mmetsp:Transcript_21415/g.46900  ORF Transcript_21415/g.46900 Transcript_21415/m.46900 type:complete len:291 (-) Transcript_21415:431-1303(-)|eukprot:CAMPEP_0202897108 /NCGR_PEP_ID=MMETSP1392-20130828/5959_1 /ASSEMBLY_ACC=CAM_ASM_000868 /TAXON_ID=225041 /ORGANISM="Chlamydomonas chlamydogama, Strain SAG 11-48b" /LENGTH=290 /DNA_ID=CAMNT_0049582667 /DNA_START=411 /DNA_END=1286 /DNA_ORIENTATION=-
MGKGERPEHMAPPEIFYNEEEARKYTSNSRMINIQTQLTERAVELLSLPQDGTPRMLLDIGCGSGLSGEQLTELGHTWVGLDISPAMLDVAADREVEGDLLLHDMGQGLPLRPGTFDGAISISAVQWLCNADKACHEPKKRLKRFFETLYAALTRGARAVLQVYPENASQAEMLVAAAMKVGFSGGLVIDYPHSTRAKKYFLVLMVGSTTGLPQGRGLDGEEPEEEEGQGGTVRVVSRSSQHTKRRRTDSGSKKGSREWVLHKKEQMRRRGYEHIPQDTKYTGRKRKQAF